MKFRTTRLFKKIHLFQIDRTTRNITVASQGVLVEEVSFIQKPFSHKEMATKIRDMIDTG